MTSLDLNRRVGPCRLLDILMAFALAIAVIIAIVLIVTLTPGKQSTSKVEEIPEEDCIDIAVIGAGVGGAYTSYKLRNKGLSISVFEYSDRVGGRYLTTTLPIAPGTYLEFGGKRFRASSHPLTNRTAIELGLKVVPFPLGFGNSDETIWYTRGIRLRKADLGTRKMPYNLAADEFNKDVSRLKWHIYSNNVNFSSDRSPSTEELYTLTTTDGTPLYNMTMDNFYGRYASREAYKYIYELGGWASSIGKLEALRNPKGALSYPGNTPAPDGVVTVEGGMEQIPVRLIEKFTEASEKHKLHLNHQLMGIERRQAGGYSLKFRRTQTKDWITTPVKTGETEVRVCARKVIIAAQRGCVEDIDFPVFKNNPEIMRNINSIVDIPTGRVFLAYNTKWWKTNNSDITHTKTDLPNRQTYDWQTGSNNVSVMMASYHDGVHASYWRELQRYGRPIPGSLPGGYAVTDVVKKRLEQYLSQIYDYKLEDIPEAVGGGMVLWDSYPYYAGWSYFKPGYDERKVNAITQKPSPSDHVYIVSNSWSPKNLQGWGEGSLVAAEEVISKYFS